MFVVYFEWCVCVEDDVVIVVLFVDLVELVVLFVGICVVLFV